MRETKLTETSNTYYIFNKQSSLKVNPAATATLSLTPTAAAKTKKRPNWPNPNCRQCRQTTMNP